jgi:Flp pilus assembly pilin Flp
MQIMQIWRLLMGKSDEHGQALAEYAISACILAAVLVKCTGIFEKAFFKYFARIANAMLVARFF